MNRRGDVAMGNTCAWTKEGPHYGSDIEYYETGCHHTFIFTDGGTIENGFNYCPFCGGEIDVSASRAAEELEAL